MGEPSAGNGAMGGQSGHGPQRSRSIIPLAWIGVGADVALAEQPFATVTVRLAGESFRDATDANVVARLVVQTEEPRTAPVVVTALAVLNAGHAGTPEVRIGAEIGAAAVIVGGALAVARQAAVAVHAGLLGRAGHPTEATVGVVMRHIGADLIAAGRAFRALGIGAALVGRDTDPLAILLAAGTVTDSLLTDAWLGAGHAA